MTKNIITSMQFIGLLTLLGIAASAPFGTSFSYVEAVSSFFLMSSGLMFATMIADPRRGGISFMFEFFMLFFIAIPAKVQISENLFPFFARLQPEHMAQAFGLIALCLLFYHLSWQFGASTKIKKRLQKRSANQDGHYYTKCAWGIAVVAFLFAIGAGPSNLFVARFERDGDLPGLTQQFLFIARSTSLLAMIMILHLSRHASSAGLRHQNFVAALLFLPAFAAINYLPALPRFVMFGVLIGLSCVYVDFFRPRNKLLIGISAVMILFLVFPVIKSLGAGEFDVSRVFSRADWTLLSAYLLRVDFDSFMQITSAIQYLEQGGEIRWGQNFLGAALFFIPRAIWPGKPDHTGMIVSSDLGYLYNNVSSPLPAEALMGFGIIGSFIVFSLLGYAVLKTEIGARSSSMEGPCMAQFFVYAIMAGFIVIILRGALNAVAPQFFTAFLILIIMEVIKRNVIRINRSKNHAE